MVFYSSHNVRLNEGWQRGDISMLWLYMLLIRLRCTLELSDGHDQHTSINSDRQEITDDARYGAERRKPSSHSSSSTSSWKMSYPG